MCLWSIHGNCDSEPDRILRHSANDAEQPILRSSREDIAKEVSERMQLALQHARDTQHVQAEAKLRQIIQLDPCFPIAQHNLAVALAEQGKRQEAIPFFRRALELDRDYFDAHRNLASTLIMLGQQKEAVNPLREAE